MISVSLCSWKIVEYYAAQIVNNEYKKQIAKKEEIEKIVEDYNGAIDSYNLILASADSATNDNEQLLQFVEDLEKIMPKDMRVLELNSLDGTVVLNVQSPDLESVADFIVETKKLTYVTSYSLPELDIEFEAIPGSSQYDEYLESSVELEEILEALLETQEEEREETEEGVIVTPPKDPYTPYLSEYSYAEYEITFKIERPETESDYETYSKVYYGAVSADGEGGSK